MKDNEQLLSVQGSICANQKETGCENYGADGTSYMEYGQDNRNTLAITWTCYAFPQKA